MVIGPTIASIRAVEAVGVGELAIAATEQVKAGFGHFRGKRELLTIESQGAPVLLNLRVAIPALICQTVHAMNLTLERRLIRRILTVILAQGRRISVYSG